MLGVLEIKEKIFFRERFGAKYLPYARYHICLMRVFILLPSIRYNMCVCHNPVYHYITATVVYLTLFVWIVSAMTVTSCRGLRIYSQALLWDSASCRRRVRALRSLYDLSLALSSNATTLNHLIRPRGSQGIQIWKQRTHTTFRQVSYVLDACVDHIAVYPVQCVCLL